MATGYTLQQPLKISHKAFGFSFNTVQIGAQLPKTIKRGRGQQKIKHPCTIYAGARFFASIREALIKIE